MNHQNIAINMEHVSKKFSVSLKQSIFYGMTDIARNMLGLRANSGSLRPGEFWAVDDVSFTVRPGEALGIIGANGAGKSTILKMLNGIFPPDRGEIRVKGRVGALIEVGVGFHPLLTGRENIYVSGAILGMSRREIDQRLDDIIEYSGVAEFIDTPVKFYSSGMYVRLGFAVAAQMRPGVLLIDEVLAVGDAAFRSKCTSSLSDMMKQGAAVVFVSHHMPDVQQICERCIWLSKGKIAAEGATPNVVSQYLQYADKQMLEGKQGWQPDEAPEARLDGARLTKVYLLDQARRRRSDFKSGEPMRVRFEYEVYEPIEALHVTFTFRSADRKIYSAYISAHEGFVIHPQAKRGAVEIVFPELLLGSGVYSVNVGLWDVDYIGAYDWTWHAFEFHVSSDRPFEGRFMLPHQWIDSGPLPDVEETPSGKKVSEEVL